MHDKELLCMAACVPRLDTIHEIDLMTIDL